MERKKKGRPPGINTPHRTTPKKEIQKREVLIEQLRLEKLRCLEEVSFYRQRNVKLRAKIRRQRKRIDKLENEYSPSTPNRNEPGER